LARSREALVLERRGLSAFTAKLSIKEKPRDESGAEKVGLEG
jgi:hypothetical protein